MMTGEDLDDSIAIDGLEERTDGQEEA